MTAGYIASQLGITEIEVNYEAADSLAKFDYASNPLPNLEYTGYLYSGFTNM